MAMEKQRQGPLLTLFALLLGAYATQHDLRQVLEDTPFLTSSFC